ncbi:MAG: alpha/beta hydrolase [Ilumatobacteraceae bacterium]
MREIVEAVSSMRAPAGRYVALPGRGRTFVRELPGPAGAPTVVLLHGWTTTAALNWSPSFGPLSRHFRVIALDHRGHGRGLRSAAPFRLEDCADDVAALLDSLGIERCIAAGYSMGGPIAQLLRRRHPGLVDGLVLCATSASFHGTRREWLLSGLATGGCLLATAPPTRPALAAAMAVARVWHRPCGLQGVGELTGHDWTKLIEAGREICRFDSRPWVHELTVPTTVLATTADDIVPPHRQLALAAAIPNASLRMVAGGHAVCTTAPQRFVPAFVAACRDVVARATPTSAVRIDAA